MGEAFLQRAEGTCFRRGNSHAYTLVVLLHQTFRLFTALRFQLGLSVAQCGKLLLVHDNCAVVDGGLLRLIFYQCVQTLYAVGKVALGGVVCGNHARDGFHVGVDVQTV